MVNINRLKGKMVEQGLNIDTLAKGIGINRATLYRRLSNGGTTITIKEADSIIKALKLSKEEINAIFFNHTVA